MKWRFQKSMLQPQQYNVTGLGNMTWVHNLNDTQHKWTVCSIFNCMHIQLVIIKMNGPVVFYAICLYDVWLSDICLPHSTLESMKYKICEYPTMFLRALCNNRYICLHVVHMYAIQFRLERDTGSLHGIGQGTNMYNIKWHNYTWLHSIKVISESMSKTAQWNDTQLKQAVATQWWSI